MKHLKYILITLLLAGGLASSAAAQDNKSFTRLPLHAKLRMQQIQDTASNSLVKDLQTYMFYSNPSKSVKPLTPLDTRKMARLEITAQKTELLKNFYKQVQAELERKHYTDYGVRLIWKRLNNLQNLVNQNPLLQDYALIVHPFLFLLTDTPCVETRRGGEEMGDSFYGLLINIVSTPETNPLLFYQPEKEVSTPMKTSLYYREYERFYKVTFDFEKRVIDVSFVPDTF